MKNGIKAVEALAIYLNDRLNCNVFKFAKDPLFTGKPYICLNYLSVQYGAWINESCIVNVNVHYPSMSNGQPNTIELAKLSDSVTELIPCRNTQTEDDNEELLLDGFRYELESDSNCMEDNDSTYFINLRVKVTF